MAVLFLKNMAQQLYMHIMSIITVTVCCHLIHVGLNTLIKFEDKNWLAFDKHGWSARSRWKKTCGNFLLKFIIKAKLKLVLNACL